MFAKCVPRSNGSASWGKGKSCRRPWKSDHFLSLFLGGVRKLEAKLQSHKMLIIQMMMLPVVLQLNSTISKDAHLRHKMWKVAISSIQAETDRKVHLWQWKVKLNLRTKSSLQFGKKCSDLKSMAHRESVITGGEKQIRKEYCAYKWTWTAGQI